jgi:hypothetical protein
MTFSIGLLLAATQTSIGEGKEAENGTHISLALRKNRTMSVMIV